MGLLNQLICLYDQHGVYLLDITLIFDICHRSSAAVTYINYECELKNATKSWILLPITNSSSSVT